MLLRVKMKEGGTAKLCTVSNEIYLALCLPIFSREDPKVG